MGYSKGTMDDFAVSVCPRDIGLPKFVCPRIRLEMKNCLSTNDYNVIVSLSQWEGGGGGW